MIWIDYFIAKPTKSYLPNMSRPKVGSFIADSYFH